MTDPPAPGNLDEVFRSCLVAATILPAPVPVVLAPDTGKPIELPKPEAPSFDAVYARHFQFVWRCLRRLGVHDSAIEDAAHDVFLVVHRQLPQFDGANQKSWLFAIAQRVAWHYRRALARRRTEPWTEERVEAESAIQPQADQEKREARELVERLLAQLSEERRAVMILGELEQLSMPEVATILRIPLNTAYSRLRLARRDFSRLLRRYEQNAQGRSR